MHAIGGQKLHDEYYGNYDLVEEYCPEKNEFLRFLNLLFLQLPQIIIHSILSRGTHQHFLSVLKILAFSAKSYTLTSRAATIGTKGLMRIGRSYINLSKTLSYYPHSTTAWQEDGQTIQRKLLHAVASILISEDAVRC